MQVLQYIFSAGFWFIVEANKSYVCDKFLFFFKKNFFYRVNVLSVFLSIRPSLLWSGRMLGSCSAARHRIAGNSAWNSASSLPLFISGYGCWHHWESQFATRKSEQPQLRMSHSTLRPSVKSAGLLGWHTNYSREVTRYCEKLQQAYASILCRRICQYKCQHKF